MFLGYSLGVNQPLGSTMRRICPPVSRDSDGGGGGAHPHSAATSSYAFISPHNLLKTQPSFSLKQWEMTAKRYLPQPRNNPPLQERKGAADRAQANPCWFYPTPRQEPEKGPASAAGIHAHVVGAAGSGPADESSDSEAEQEGPQKLIRKVSTSGQIRSKVRRIYEL